MLGVEGDAHVTDMQQLTDREDALNCTS